MAQTPISSTCTLRPGLLALALATLAVLPGCGGGGGSSSQPPAPTSTAPSFTTQPANAAVNPGSPATFSASAAGSPAPTLQWSRSNDGGATWTALAAATSASYTLASAGIDDNHARFQLVASNSAGSATSSAAVLTVNAAQGAASDIALAPSTVPLGIASGPDGNVWFTNSSGGQIGTISAISHLISTVNLPTTTCMPTGIVAGPDGRMWFTEQATAKIGAITLDGKSISEYAALGQNPTGIAAGPDQALWYTLQASNAIGRMTVAGTAGSFPVGTANAAPLGITLGQDGNLWFTEQAAGQIARITPAGTQTEYLIPTPAGGVKPSPQRIIATADGALWFTDQANNQVVRFTPPAGSAAPAGSRSRLTAAASSFQSVPLPAGSKPVGLAADPAGNVWVANQGTGQVTLVTPALTTTNFPLASASGQPTNMVVGADGNLYVTQPGTGAIAQVVTAPAPAAVTIAVNPAAAQLLPGSSLAFSALVAGVPDTRATWLIREGASGGSITAQGLYTAPATAGSYHVIATSVADPSKSATATVTVAAPASPVITSFSASPAALAFGQSAALSAVYSGGNGSVGGLGALASGASLTVTPAGTTTYTLTVTGTGGTATATTTVTVSLAITAPASVASGATGLIASVPQVAGCTYAWSIAGGTITAGAGTSQITFSAGTSGSVNLGCTVSTGAGTPSSTASAVCGINVPAPVISAFTLTPGNAPFGQATTLAATYAGGTGNVTGVGALASGSTLTVFPVGPVTYTLVVTNATGATASATATTTANVQVTAPLTATASATGLIASVPQVANCSYAWTLIGGSITTGQNTSQITFTAGAAGSISLACAVYSAAGSATGTATCAITTPAPVISSFTASQNVVGPGGTVTLTAVFSGGTGAIDQFIGPVSSGTAVVSRPITQSSTFTLTVSNADGVSMVASTQVLVGSMAAMAGVPSGEGNSDGYLAAARFNYPHFLAVDAGGNLYVSDTNSHTIRKVTPAWTVTTVAGLTGVAGHVDGPAGSARFSAPTGVAVDSAGNLYVADTGNLCIRKISASGQVSTLAGTVGQTGFADGPAASASFNGPLGLAVDGAGNVYVADQFNNTIRKITTAGVVSTVAGRVGIKGSANGALGVATFTNPTGVVVDALGNLYVADNGNCTIRKVDPTGLVSTVAGTPGTFGAANGTGASASFTLPYGLALDAQGNLYIGDAWDHLVRMITPSGVVTTLAGMAYQAGYGDGASGTRFNQPDGIAVDAAGNVYVADCGNNAIRKISAAGVVTTLAGEPSFTGAGNGSWLGARLNNPQGVAVDALGNTYVADANNNSIRKLTPGGATSTLAGTGALGYLDGPGASATFTWPNAVATDAAGNVYVADHTSCTIRKITPAGSVSTLAGTGGQVGFADGQGAAAKFSYPSGLVVDAQGNVYVADSFNYVIRKITPGGLVSTLAGSPGVSNHKDGLGAAANFFEPYGIVLDASGNLLVSDAGGDTIRKVTAAGAVTTLAGSPLVAGFANGPSAGALFAYPTSLALDGAGNLYVADTNNQCIRRISAAGQVSTLVGAPGLAGNESGPLPARIAYPAGLAIDPTTGNLLITVTDALLQVGLDATSPVPATPAITVSASITIGSSNNLAWVAPQPGCTYAWTITGGTIPGNANGNVIRFTAGSGGAGSLTCVVANGAGQSSTATASFTNY